MYCVDIARLSARWWWWTSPQSSSKEHKPTENMNSSMLLDLSWPVDAWLCGLECPDWPVQLIGLIWICARMNVTVLLCLISTTYSTSSGPDWPRAVRADPDGHQRHPHPPHPAPLLDSLRQGRWTQWGKWYRERLLETLIISFRKM